MSLVGTIYQQYKAFGLPANHVWLTCRKDIPFAGASPTPEEVLESFHNTELPFLEMGKPVWEPGSGSMIVNYSGCPA